MNKLSVLEKLEDKTLLSQLRDLLSRENQLLAEILLHLIEVEKRRLFADYGYSSMFSYCTKGLGLTEASAHRRITSARAMLKFPELYQLLAEGKVNCTTVSLISKFLTENNKEELLGSIVGKSVREVEAVVAEQRPVAEKPRERIKVIAHKSVAKSSIKGELPLFAEDLSVKDRTFSAESSTKSEEIEKRWQLQFSLGGEQKEKLDWVKAHLSTKYPLGLGLEEMLAELLELYLEKHSPERKQERREKRKQRGNNSMRVASEERSRHIPAELRDAVFVRDGGSCTFIGVDGRSCGSCHGVEVDHIVPFSIGGEHSLSNLRLRCRTHNRLEAERVFGREKMEQFVRFR